MIEQLITWDKELFLFLNSHHNSFWDFVMWWMSNKLVWIPVYAYFIYLIIKSYKKKSLIIIIFVALLITLTDQVSVHLFKEVFLRLRPCHDPSLASFVHIVNDKCGGQFGFVSSHAANYFGIALFMILFFGRKVRNFSWLVLLWVAGIGYSRIYLGVHFPGDVIGGALLGSFFGYVMARLCMAFLPVTR
ncbi:MAG: phosphatase PAP2 family protein [Bacteroidales bacterium]|nr:phosphatase PAP2 family protein [Bacteroidales bacterium]